MSKTAISRNSNRTMLFINMKEETAKRKTTLAFNVQELGKETAVFSYYSKLTIIKQGTGTASTF